MNNYAITSEELATSLEKSSAALVAAGNNVEQAQALEIAGNTILQDSDTVANALKVLSMRLRGTSASALEDVGEDTEGLIENASKLYETIKNLTKTQSNPKGVEIIDKETNAYKSTYDILLEISKVWDDINDTNKAALLEAIAGKTRGAAAAAILQNSEILESAYTDAMYNAEGAGTEALEASLDSIEKKVEIFQNKLQHFAQSLIDSGLIKWFVDAGNSILDFGDKIGSLRSLLGIGTFAFGINKNFNLENTPSYINNIKDLFKPNQKQLDYLKVGQFAKGQSNYSSIDMSAINKFIELFNSGKTESEAFAMSMVETNNETRSFASNITDVAGNALSEFTKGSKLASIATELFSSGLLALGTMALEWGINALIKYSKRLKESVDNLKQASEEQEKYNNTIVDAIDKYNELYNKLQKTNKGTNEYIQIQNDLLNVQNSLKESFEDEANNLDLVNGKYNEQIAILKEAQREKAKDYTLANEKDYENNIKYLDKNSNKTASNLAVASVSDNFQNLLKEYGVSIEEDLYGNNISTYSYDYDSVKDTYTNLKSLLKELKESDKFKNETSYKAIYDWIYNEYNSLDLTRIEDALSNIETYNKMMALGNASYSDSYQELQNKATEYNNALSSHDQDRIATAKAEFDALVNDINIDGIEEEGIRDAFQAIVDSISEDLLKSNDWYNRLNNSSKFTKGQFTEAEVKSALDSKNFLTGETGRKSLTDVGQLVSTSGINVDDEKEVNQFIAVLKDLGYIVDNFAETKVPKISTTLLNANEASEKLTSSLSSAYSAYETLLNPTANPQEMLDAISSINSAAKELNLEIDWEKIFSDGEFSTDELDLQLELIRNKTKEQLLDLFEFEDMPSGWETFIDGMVNSIVDTQKATSEFNNLTNAIDRLQSSYSTLTDVMDTLNSGNGLSIDQLQSLISAEDNYIEMLTVENGQLTINQEKYKELIAEQLLSFRAKLDEAAAKEIDALANDNLAKSTAKASEEIVKNTGYLGKNTIAAYSNALAKGVDEDSIKSVIQKYDAIWNAAVDKYNGGFTSFMNGDSDSSGEDKTQEYKELLDKQLEILQAQLDAGYIDFKDYISKRRDLIEEYYAQNKISAEDYYSELNDLYEEQLSIYDRVIKAVEKQIDEQIDGYNKQKDAIDEEIEKLQDANNEREKAIDLQEKQYALAKAENQRTRLVYRNGQLQYLSDPEEIRNARKDLADAELEKQVDALEKQKDSIDDLIQKAEEYKDKWSEISTILEEMQDKELADSILGDNWEDLVNALNPGIFENFKNGYLDLQRTIADNKIQLAEVEYQTQLDNISSNNGKNSVGYRSKNPDDIDLPTTNQKFSVYDTKSGELLGLFDDYIEAQKRVQELAKISGNNNYGIKGLSFDDNGFAESVETIDGHLKNWHLYIGDADAKAIELNKRFEEAKANVNNISIEDIEKKISKISGKKFTFNIDAKDNASEDITKISKEEIPDKIFGINANDKDASKKLSEIEKVYINNKDVLIKAIGEDNFYKVISSIEDIKLKDKIQYIFANASNADEKIKELSDYVFDVKKLLIETFGQEKANEIFSELEDGNLEKLLEIITNSEDSETKLEKINQLINSIPTSKSSNVDVTTTYREKHIIETETTTIVNPKDLPKNVKEYAKASGTFSNGTAFAKGKDVTNGYDGTALVGELGAEMRIREGKFELIGKNGAEFTDVKKNDIIFNH